MSSLGRRALAIGNDCVTMPRSAARFARSLSAPARASVRRGTPAPASQGTPGASPRTPVLRGSSPLLFVWDVRLEDDVDFVYKPGDVTVHPHDREAFGVDEL